MIVSKQLLQQLVDEEFSRAVLKRRAVALKEAPRKLRGLRVGGMYMNPAALGHHEDTPLERAAEHEPVSDQREELRAVLHAVVEEFGAEGARREVEEALQDAIESAAAEGDDEDDLDEALSALRPGLSPKAEVICDTQGMAAHVARSLEREGYYVSWNTSRYGYSVYVNADKRLPSVLKKLFPGAEITAMGDGKFRVRD